MNVQNRVSDLLSYITTTQGFLIYDILRGPKSPFSCWFAVHRYAACVLRLLRYRPSYLCYLFAQNQSFMGKFAWHLRL